MKKQSELTNWLHTQKSAGQVESVGTFSIDRQKAWEKLGAFQLPFETAWVLKLVQALNSCSESEELKITQNRVESIFCFRGIKEWNHPELETAVFNPERNQTGDIGHLAVAIRALAQVKTRPFSLSYPKGRTVIWNGSAFSEPPQAESEALSEALGTADFELTVSHFRFGESTSYFSYERPEVKQTMIEISKTVSDSCFLSPCPITLDGRRIQGLESSLVFGPVSNRRILTKAAIETAPGFPVLQAMLEAGPPRWDSESGSWTAGDDQQECSAMATITAHLEAKKINGKLCYYKPSQGPIEVHWIHLEVIVERERIAYDSLANLVLFASAKDLNTDLSGLSLRDDDIKSNRLDNAGRVLFQRTDEILANLDIPNVSLADLDAHYSKSTHVTSCCIGCVMGPLGWLASFFINKAQHKQARKIAQALPGELRASVKELLKMLGHTKLSDLPRQRQ